MLRMHDVVIADGTFRVVLTPQRRVVAVLNAPQTMLGPLHVAFEIDRGSFLPEGVPRDVLHRSYATAGFFDDVGDVVKSAAQGAFSAASNAATTVAAPAVNLLQGAASEGAHLVAKVAPALAEAVVRKPVEQAAQLVLRARLGDLDAKGFLRGIASAANAGIEGAKRVGDVLLDASSRLARVADIPVMLTKPVPVLGDLVQAASPLEQYQKLVGALQKGDFNAIKRMAEERLRTAASVASLVPGLGTGISSAIGAGLAALDGGSPLEIALRAAYGAIPIPPGVRQVTDVVLDTVLALAREPDLSEVALQVARDRVPAGIARDVFDSLAQIIVRRVPVQKAAASLVDHYVQQYAPSVTVPIEEAIRGLSIDPHLRGLDPQLANIARLPRLVQPLHRMP